MSFEVFVFLIILALAFDFMNGFHDAANSIATVVSTGVLRPHHAVAFAAFFNFAALFIFQLKVAATVGKGIVDPSIVDHYVICLLYTSPSPRDRTRSRMPSSA